MTERAGSSTSRVLELGCWGLATLLMALYFGARAFGESERREGITHFAEARAEMNSQAASDRSPGWLGETIFTDAVEPAPAEKSVVSSRAEFTDKRLSTEAAEWPEGILRIQRVGLEVPVYADVSERNLNRGAGLIADTGLPGSAGNVAIAAHRDGYFRVLERVVVGDLIALESLSGIQRYRVTELSVVEPDDLTPLHELGVPAVTLVTCYPFYFVGSAPQRYIVRAVATE